MVLLINNNSNIFYFTVALFILNKKHLNKVLNKFFKNKNELNIYFIFWCVIFKKLLTIK